MRKLKLVPAAFDPKQADIKESDKKARYQETDESTREREYAGRIENASDRFHTQAQPQAQPYEDEEDDLIDSDDQAV